MDFDLTEEQSLIADQLWRFLGDACTFEKRKAALASPDAFRPDVWQGLADLGLMALPFAEADGGLGGGPAETMIVMKALGRGLVLEPWFETVVLAGAIVRHAGSAAQRERLVGEIGAGGLRMALATTERHSRYDLAHVTTRAERDGDGWRLTGEKGVVIGGDVADRIVVSARCAGSDHDTDGIGLFIVDPDGPGASRRPYRTQDGRSACELSLESAFVGTDAVLGDPAHGLPVLRHAVGEGIAALCAEAAGVLEMMHALTLDYIKTRKQFGRPISDFQVIQHRAADMFIAVEEARSMAFLATQALSEDDPHERARSLSAAKARIGQCGRFVGEEAIQLHGGVGMTMEYAIGHYFKRMTMIDIMFGDAGYHLRALAGMPGAD